MGSLGVWDSRLWGMLLSRIVRKFWGWFSFLWGWGFGRCGVGGRGKGKREEDGMEG